MQIFVRYPAQDILITLEVEPTDIVAVLLDMIMEKIPGLKLPGDGHRLIYNSKSVMADMGRPLSFYNIQKETILYLFCPLRGD
jgi:hypothetical protein